MPRLAPDVNSMEQRIAKLERETRLLKRACALLLALLAAGIMIVQGMVRNHIDGHPPAKEAPAQEDAR